MLGSPTGSLKGKQGEHYFEYMDMTLEEQQEWEEREMANEVDFLNCHIDPAPFQLVEKSSLLKVSISRFNYATFQTYYLGINTCYFHLS